MKKIIISALIIASVLLVSCHDDKKAAQGKAAPDADPSYAFGIAIGNSIKETGVTINFDKFLKGVKDVAGNKTPSMTNEEAGKIIQEAITKAAAKKGEENIAKEKSFFETNGKRKGVVTTASGLQYEVLKEGTGAAPKATDIVKVNYVGTLLDGTTFDSTVARNEPAEFPLDRVIPGWAEGIQLMKVGEKAKLYIPSRLAYGSNGIPGKIAANETLVFEVELLEVTAPAAGK